MLLTGVSHISWVYAKGHDVIAVACRFLDDDPDAADFLRETVSPFYGFHEQYLKTRGPLKLSDDELKKKNEEIKQEFN